jgi:hypothetical protein
MPMITSGWPREPKSAQLVAGRNQSSPFAFNIIAERIIEVACDGERDPDEACARALRAFGFQQSPNC